MEYYLSYCSFVVISRVLIIKVSYGSFFFRQVLWLNNTRFHTGVKCWKLILRSGAHPTQSLTCCRGDVIEIKFWRFSTFVLSSQFLWGVSVIKWFFLLINRERNTFLSMRMSDALKWKFWIVKLFNTESIFFD